MASTISAGTTSGTAIAIAGDTSGALALQTNNGTTAVTIDTSQKATFVNDVSISGLTVGKGGGTVATNTAVGYQAINASATGTNNTAVGYQAMYANTTGTSNVAMGYLSLDANTTGTQNTSIGVSALTNNTTGGSNVAVGVSALEASTTGASNTAIGENAGAGITTGQYNNIIGSRNTTLTTGEYNIQIGRFANASASSVSYSLMINTDNTARTDKGSSSGFIFVGGSIYQGNNSAAWAITSDARLKKNIVNNTTGLDAINAIQVRNFEYRTADEITDLPKDQAVDVQGIQLGAIAQEIQAILPECVKTESTGVMSVDTTNLTWYLINAVKELNAKITALENK